MPAARPIWGDGKPVLIGGQVSYPGLSGLEISSPMKNPVSAVLYFDRDLLE
jgi:hypothetical protein